MKRKKRERGDLGVKFQSTVLGSWTWKECSTWSNISKTCFLWCMSTNQSFLLCSIFMRSFVILLAAFTAIQNDSSVLSTAITSFPRCHPLGTYLHSFPAHNVFWFSFLFITFTQVLKIPFSCPFIYCWFPDCTIVICALSGCMSSVDHCLLSFSLHRLVLIFFSDI